MPRRIHDCASFCIRFCSQCWSWGFLCKSVSCNPRWLRPKRINASKVQTTAESQRSLRIKRDFVRTSSLWNMSEQDLYLKGTWMTWTRKRMTWFKRDNASSNQKSNMPSWTMMHPGWLCRLSWKPKLFRKGQSAKLEKFPSRWAQKLCSFVVNSFLSQICIEDIEDIRGSWFHLISVRVTPALYSLLGTRGKSERFDTCIFLCDCA